MTESYCGAKNVLSLEATVHDIGVRLHRHNTEQPTSEPSAEYVPQHHRSQPDPADAIPERLLASQDSSTKDLDLLNRMLCEEDGALKDYLQQCKDRIEAERQKSSANRFGTIADHTNLAGQDILADILIRICRRRSRDPSRHHVGPTVSEVIRLFLKHKVMDHRWHDVFGIQIGALLESVHDPISAEVTREIPDHAAPIFEELLKFWAIYLEDDEAKRILKGPAIKVSSYLPLRDFSESHVSNQRVDIITGAAILADAYWQLMIEKDIPISISTETAKSLRQISERLTKNEEPDRHVFQGLSTCLLEYGTPLHIIDKAIDKAMVNCLLFRSNVEKLKIRSPHTVDKNDNMAWDLGHVEVMMRRLFFAELQSYSKNASDLWKIFQTKSMREDRTREYQENVFFKFIRAFFKVQRPDLAVEAWNLMIKSDIVPDSRLWHYMMLGSARSKDIASMHTCWFQGKAAGIEFNMLTWTTRINYLIRCGEWRLGIEALEEVGQLWKKMPELKESEKMGPVTGAITALLDLEMSHAVSRVIDWAKVQKLPLGVVAFNAMLASATKRGESKRVGEILSQMRLQNCPPNMITFNILIDGRLTNRNSSFHTQSPDSQQSTILNFLNTVQQKGFQLNPPIYSTIVSRLLAADLVNIPVASAVLKHMVENKVQFSDFLGITLMKHFFKAIQPDLPFIDCLWRSIRRDLTVVLPELFDVVIQNYARIGEVERMLDFARQMPVQGKTQSWKTLSIMLAVLVRAQKWQLTDNFIDDLTDGKNGLRQPHDEDGGIHFWDVVSALREKGLLKPKKTNIKVSRWA